uniref:Uncharacterized protein n=1 Tax=Rhizophora mucronata TaxID=61149 RepID=A0A2P2NF12_RHIMU
MDRAEIGLLICTTILKTGQQWKNPYPIINIISCT